MFQLSKEEQQGAALIVEHIRDQFLMKPPPAGQVKSFDLPTIFLLYGGFKKVEDKILDEVIRRLKDKGFDAAPDPYLTELSVS